MLIGDEQCYQAVLFIAVASLGLLRIRETTVDKGLDSTVVKQILKEMEDLKIAMAKKSEDQPTSSKYTNHRCIWCDTGSSWFCCI